MSVLLALLLAFAPNLTARWDTSTSATVQWSQQSRACLYRQPRDAPAVFVGCYEKVGSITLTFGAMGPLDAAYRPTAGDVYVLQTTAGITKAPLRGREVYLAIIR